MSVSAKVSAKAIDQTSTAPVISTFCFLGRCRVVSDGFVSSFSVFFCTDKLSTLPHSTASYQAIEHTATVDSVTFTYTEKTRCTIPEYIDKRSSCREYLSQSSHCHHNSRLHKQS